MAVTYSELTKGMTPAQIADIERQALVRGVTPIEVILKSQQSPTQIATIPTISTYLPTSKLPGAEQYAVPKSSYQIEQEQLKAVAVAKAMTVAPLITSPQFLAQKPSGLEWGDYFQAALQTPEGQKFVAQTGLQQTVKYITDPVASDAQKNIAQRTILMTWAQKYNPSLADEISKGIGDDEATFEAVGKRYGAEPVVVVISKPTAKQKAEAQAKLKKAPPLTSEQQIAWEREAQQLGIKDTYAYAQQKWLAYYDLTPTDIARAGKEMTGVATTVKGKPAIIYQPKDMVKIAKEAAKIEIERKEFEAKNIIIGEQAMSIDAWNKLPEKYQSIALKSDFDIMSKAIENDQAIVKKLETAGYIKGNTIDITSYLKDNPKDIQVLIDLGITQQVIKQAQEQLEPPKVWVNVRTGKKITDAEYRALGSSIKVDEYVRDLSSPIAREALIEIIPIVGTIHYAQRAAKGGFTPAEIGWLSLYTAIDIATVAFGVGAMAAGARAARGVGTMARLSGAARGAGQFVVAEIKAPYTMIRHPVATAKTIYRPFETLLHPKAVPIAAVETSFTTVRLPVRATKGDVTAARRLRDATTDAAIYGREAKATVKGTTVKLSPTALNKVGAPVAVHTTPDVRPFMDGAVIRAGREGGMYIAPNVHERFAFASAFGDLPEGGIKGALVIRDEKVLKALAPSDKIFRRTAEIEALLPPGTQLGRPSQTIFTRDISGDRLVLLIFGEPFTPAQVAKLKLIGSIDTIGQIFTPAIKISQSERGAIKALDEMVDLTKQRTKLAKEIGAYRKAGDTKRLVKAEQSMARLTRRIDDLRPGIKRGLSTRAITRASIVLAQYTDRGVLERWQDSSVARPSVTRKDNLIIRKLSGVDTRRIGTSEKRPEITRARATIERPPVERPLIYSPDRVPPRTPPRTPLRQLPERLPEYPLIRMPPEKPPKRLLTKTLLERPPVRPPIPEIKEVKAKRKDYEGAVAWQQGGLLRKGKLVPVWKVWSRPYEQKDLETFFEDELPVGVKKVKGIKSAYATIQQFRGELAPRETQQADIGAFIATIHQPTAKPGGAGEIKFKRDYSPPRLKHKKINKKKQGKIEPMLVGVRT